MGDALDFLVKGKVDIASIEEYLNQLGYTAKNLTQPYRHVVGKVEREGKEFFFKMASRPQLSIYIENEFAWLKLIEETGLDKNWELKIPRVYETGQKENLSWWIGEYISGVSADDNPSFLSEVLIPTAKIVKNIIEIKLPHKMPLDLDRSGLNMDSLMQIIFNKLDAYEKRIPQDIGHLTAFLKKNKDWIQIAPARGDIGAGSFIKEKNNVVWLIDWEFARGLTVKFYDLSYFQYRLFVDIGRPDWANEYLKAFRRIYRFDKKDEKTFQWMNVYRLVGGYNEAGKRISYVKKVEQWERYVWPVK